MFSFLFKLSWICIVKTINAQSLFMNMCVGSGGLSLLMHDLLMYISTSISK